MSNSPINWQDFKVRCSAITKILANSRSNPVLTEKQAIRMEELEKKATLTEVQTKELAELQVKKENGSKIILSDTCIEYLMEEYAWRTQKMIPVNKESLDLMALKKGKEGEGEAITMLIRLDKQWYKVHKERISNEYLSGEIDIYLGEEVMRATKITDIKNALDYPAFLKKINNGLENGQKEQVQGYMDITGAGEGEIANCLVSMSEELIIEMKWKVAKKMNAISIESPDFLEEWPKWERSMRFDHIPIQQRVFKIPIEPFSEFDRQRIYDRVKICRDWLSTFDEAYQKLNQS